MPHVINPAEAAEIEQIKGRFKQYDLDGDGFISLQELSHVMRACGDFSNEELKDMFEEMDKSGDGKVEYDEFIDWVMAADDSDDETQAPADEEPLQPAEALRSSVQSSDVSAWRGETAPPCGTGGPAPAGLRGRRERSPPPVSPLSDREAAARRALKGLAPGPRGLGAGGENYVRPEEDLRDPGVTTGPGDKLCKVSDVEAAVRGEQGWTLVRHVPPGEGWHPSNDKLRGTDEYGDPAGGLNSSSAWSVKFDIDSVSEFLFATGNCVMWLRATKDAVIGDSRGYENEQRQVLTSSSSAAGYVSAPYSARWYNRPSSPEDPWISLEDHKVSLDNGGMLYGEDGFESAQHTASLLRHEGANVFVRPVQALTDYDPTVETPEPQRKPSGRGGAVAWERSQVGRQEFFNVDVRTVVRGAVAWHRDRSCSSLLALDTLLFNTGNVRMALRTCPSPESKMTVHWGTWDAFERRKLSKPPASVAVFGVPWCVAKQIGIMDGVVAEDGKLPGPDAICAELQRRAGVLGLGEVTAQADGESFTVTLADGAAWPQVDDPFKVAEEDEDALADFMPTYKGELDSVEQCGMIAVPRGQNAEGDEEEEDYGIDGVYGMQGEFWRVRNAQIGPYGIDTARNIARWKLAVKIRGEQLARMPRPYFNDLPFSAFDILQDQNLADRNKPWWIRAYEEGGPSQGPRLRSAIWELGAPVACDLFVAPAAPPQAEAFAADLEAASATKWSNQEGAYEAFEEAETARMELIKGVKWTVDLPVWLWTFDLTPLGEADEETGVYGDGETGWKQADTEPFNWVDSGLEPFDTELPPEGVFERADEMARCVADEDSAPYVFEDDLRQFPGGSGHLRHVCRFCRVTERVQCWQCLCDPARAKTKEDVERQKEEEPRGWIDLENPEAWEGAPVWVTMPCTVIASDTLFDPENPEEPPPYPFNPWGTKPQAEKAPDKVWSEELRQRRCLPESWKNEITIPDSYSPETAAEQLRERRQQYKEQCAREYDERAKEGEESVFWTGPMPRSQKMDVRRAWLHHMDEHE